MLVITLGDPFGVNVELIVRSWEYLAQMGQEITQHHTSQSGWGVIIVGSYFHWNDQLQRLNQSLSTSHLEAALKNLAVFSACEPLGTLGSKISEKANAIVFIDTDHIGDRKVGAQVLTDDERGSCSKRALDFLNQEFFKRWTFSRERLAVLTGPIDKYAAEKAGFDYPGQTEFFEELWNQKAIMILAGPRLRVGLVTNHHALREVPEVLSRDLIVTKIQLFVQSFRELFFYERPKIAVTGLNPHAGDSGKFGDEEGRLIIPAIQMARAFLPDLEIIGPLPADTAFYSGYQGSFDGVLAMYHDQGLGPLKTVHFDEAVNISGGLPHLRISPDHGPAKDLFLKGRASAKSMSQALMMAKTYLGL